MEKMKELFCALNYYEYAIKILHWRACGTDFEGNHEKMNGYLQKFIEMTDEIAENILALGEDLYNYDDIRETLKQSSNSYIDLDIKKSYDGKALPKSIKDIFECILKLYEEIVEDNQLPPDVKRVLHKQMSWFRIELRYKNAAELR